MSTITHLSPVCKERKISGDDNGRDQSVYFYDQNAIFFLLEYCTSVL